MIKTHHVSVQNPGAKIASSKHIFDYIQIHTHASQLCFGQKANCVLMSLTEIKCYVISIQSLSKLRFLEYNLK